MTLHIPPMTELLIRGKSKKQIARDMGVTHQAVQYWFKRGFIPFNRVAEIEARYGIPRIQLLDPKLLTEIEPIRFDDLTDGE